MGAVRPAQYHLDARQQLHRFKRLDDVILRSQPQALHPIGNILPRGEKDDRGAAAARLFHQRKTVLSGQHHIQQRQIILARQQPGQRVGAVIA